MGFKFNPFTGTLDLVGAGSSGSSPENFSYVFIQTGRTVTVPQYQQMLYRSELTVEGELVVNGDTIEV